MQIIYEFSRQEIQNHSIANFQSLFGIDRLKEAGKVNPSVLAALMGSLKIYFRLGRKALLHYEDPDIRALCEKLVHDTPAVFLSSTNDRTMMLLFYCTLNGFSVANSDLDRHRKFHSNGLTAAKHTEFLRNRIISVARELRLSPVHYGKHVARVNEMFPLAPLAEAA